jgi:hypothetical protein
MKVNQSVKRLLFDELGCLQANILFTLRHLDLGSQLKYYLKNMLL